MQPRSPSHPTSPPRFPWALPATILATALGSLLVLAFAGDALATYSAATDGGTAVTASRYPANAPGGLYLAQYPLDLARGALTPAIAGAALSLALALSLGGSCRFVGRRGKGLLLADWQRRVLFVVLGGNCVLALVVFLVGAVERFRSARFDPAYRSPATGGEGYGPGGRYDGGAFDLGSWACQMSADAAFDDGGRVLARECIDSTAALWVGLLLVLSNLGMTGLVWVDWRGRKSLIRGWNALQDEYQDEYI